MKLNLWDQVSIHDFLMNVYNFEDADPTQQNIPWYFDLTLFQGVHTKLV